MFIINFLMKIIHIFGVKLRNPSYFRIYNELKKSEFASKEELQTIQLEKLRKLLEFSVNNSPYYKELFKEVGFDINRDFSSLSDLKKIPVITKKDLISRNSEIHTINDIKFKKIFISETSGSSGEPLMFKKDERWDSFNRASIARGLSWFNVDVSEFNGYCWGYSFSFKAKIKTMLLDLLMNRFRCFKYTDASIDKFIRRSKRASYISGYSSMIYEMAKRVNSRNLTIDNLKLVKGTSEKIYDHYQNEVIQAFGSKMISEYGSAESGIIAFECPHGSMHINEETCIVEVIDGEIIVTNLIGYSFPTIRYKLGDYVSISDQKCKCGRNHSIISDVLGRIGKNIVGLNDSTYPSLTLYYIFKSLALEFDISLNYTAVQNEVGSLDIYIQESVNEECLRHIKKLSNDYFDMNINVNIKDNSNIHSKEKKLKDFESNL